MTRPIVMTLLVRNEADIVGTNIEYHLTRGVTHILAVDNLSVDGTSEILLEYQRMGVLTYERENANTHDQSAWVTRMAMLAFDRYPSSIVFHVDADEFWWPLEGSLIGRLNSAFANFNGVGTVKRSNYLGPNLNVSAVSFLERCVYRQKHSVNALGSPLPGKVCHRASAKVTVGHGNHHARLPDNVAPDRAIDGIEVLHFPNRSFDQFVEKTTRGASALRNNPNVSEGVGQTWLTMDTALRSGRFMRDFPEQFITEQDIVERLLVGEIVPCQKLRDYVYQYCHNAQHAKAI